VCVCFKQMPVRLPSPCHLAPPLPNTPPPKQRLRDDSAASAPLRRGVTLDDIGGMAAFLASDAGAGVTGQVLRVDCGASAVMM
jgi:NAD(P)-dependent dehydrogenase (short-subunit alcohol dehydrogenase family)